MIDVRFEVGGRRVNPNNLGNALEKAVYSQVRDSIAKSLRGVRCSEHGSSPRVTVKGRSLDNLSFEVEGCCQDLIDRALRQLQ